MKSRRTREDVTNQRSDPASKRPTHLRDSLRTWINRPEYQTGHRRGPGTARPSVARRGFIEAGAIANHIEPICLELSAVQEGLRLISRECKRSSHAAALYSFWLAR